MGGEGKKISGPINWKEWAIYVLVAVEGFTIPLIAILFRAGGMPPAWFRSDVIVRREVLVFAVLSSAYLVMAAVLSRRWSPLANLRRSGAPEALTASQIVFFALMWVNDGVWTERLAVDPLENYDPTLWLVLMLVGPIVVYPVAAATGWATGHLLLLMTPRS